MPDVLIVPAFEFGHPLPLVVLMKTGDSLIQLKHPFKSHESNEIQASRRDAEIVAGGQANAEGVAATTGIPPQKPSAPRRGARICR